MGPEAPFVLPSEECPLQEGFIYYISDEVEPLDESNELNLFNDSFGTASTFQVSDSVNWRVTLPEEERFIYIQNPVEAQAEVQDNVLVEVKIEVEDKVQDEVQDSLAEFLEFQKEEKSNYKTEPFLPSESDVDVDLMTVAEKSPRVCRKFNWNCTFCLEPYPTRNSLTTHMKQHCLPFCIHCLKKVSTLNRLVKHKLKMHGIGTEKNEKTDKDKAVERTSKYGRRRLVFNTRTLLDNDLEYSF